MVVVVRRIFFKCCTCGGGGVFVGVGGDRVGWKDIIILINVIF